MLRRATPTLTHRRCAVRLPGTAAPSPPAFCALCAVVAMSVAMSACNTVSSQKPVNEFGAGPELPQPEQRLVPTIHVAPAQGWPSGASPVAAQGLRVQRFADGLTHPRWLYVLPNG